MPLIAALAALLMAAPAHATLYGAQPATGDIVTVDPATGAVTGSFDAPDDLSAGDVLVGLSGAEGALIYRNDDGDQPDELFRVNRASGAVLSTETTGRFDTDGLSFQTAADSTPLIFSSHSGSDLHRQEGFSGPDSFFWAVGEPRGGLGGDGLGREFGFFNEGGLSREGSLSVAIDGSLHEYDPFTDTDAFISTLPSPAADIQGLAYDGTSLYASTASGTLYTLDPDTGAVRRSVTVASGALFALGATKAEAAPSPPPPPPPAPPAPSNRPKCFGKTATIVATGQAVVFGTSHADVIVGTDAGETIFGRGGNDRICAGKGNDTARGGVGNDKVRGGDGADTLFGNSGNDLLLGRAGDDTLLGNRGDDRTGGGDGDDLVRGGKGDDKLDEMSLGGNGRDQLLGNSGEDRVRTAGGQPDQVDCGPDSDSVLLDTLDDEDRCEDVTRRQAT